MLFSGLVQNSNDRLRHIQTEIDTNVATGDDSIKGGVINRLQSPNLNKTIIVSNTIQSTFKQPSQRNIATYIQNLIPQKCKNFHPPYPCDMGLDDLYIVLDGSYSVRGEDWMVFKNIIKNLVQQLRHQRTFLHVIISSSKFDRGFEEINGLNGKLCEKWSDIDGELNNLKFKYRGGTNETVQQTINEIHGHLADKSGAIALLVGRKIPKLQYLPESSVYMFYIPGWINNPQVNVDMIFQNQSDFVKAVSELVAEPLPVKQTTEEAPEEINTSTVVYNLTPVNIRSNIPAAPVQQMQE